MQIEGIHIE